MVYICVYIFSFHALFIKLMSELTFRQSAAQSCIHIYVEGSANQSRCKRPRQSFSDNHVAKALC